MAMEIEEELSSLIRKLNDESAFIQSEKKHIIDLYRQLLKKSEHLFHKQWIIGRQQLILDDLIFGRINSSNSSKYLATSKQISTKYSKLNEPTTIKFIESHKLLGHNDYYVSECLKQLRDNPKILANYLVKSELKHQSNQYLTDLIISNQQLIPIIFQSLYGNCILVQDELFCLQLLKNLIELQFTSNNTNTNNGTLNDLFINNIDLRKLIRKTTCSFNIMFKYYMTLANSTQLFLTTCLREPITQLLSDEWYLDIDCDKALGRFTNDELQARFGPLNSKEYKLKTLKYREKIVNQLHQYTLMFIESISSNLFCFPASLAWLVNQLYFHVNRTSQDASLARKLCCDLVMALFICPAICDPEPYGIIVDIQVNSVARHNLMQIANILQVLALSDDDKDLKAQDLYCKFRNNCVSDILNSIIAPNIRNSQQDNLGSLFAFDPIQSTFLSMFNNNEQTSVNNNSNNQSNLLQRSSVIISIQDIHKLLIFLRQLSKELPADSDELKWLKSIIPNDYLNQILEQTVNNLNSTKQMNLTLTRRQSEQNLISLFNSESTEVINYLLKEPDLLEDYQILVLNINDKSLECPGMLNEDKIIKEYELNKKQLHTINNNNNNNNLDSSFEPNSLLNKIPSFGIMINDQDDISEACETNDRSLSSSNDHDDDHDHDEDVERINNRVKDNNDDRGDGLSDFDNFSGRDTPIISGRDTSSSHSHEDLHNISSSNNMLTNNINNNNSSSSNNFNQNRQNNLINQRLNNANNNINQTNLNNGININNNRGPNILPVTVQKTNREDINDKFCKFEISKTNQPIKDEQMSEAWSLDPDPPESVINDPLLDDNTNIVNLNRSNSITNNNKNSSSDVNLILLDINNEQEKSLKSINDTQLTADEANNLDDHYSIISDSTAWSTDQIMNSDSDLESNSPSKYTSSYSRTSSYQNSDFSSYSNNYSNQSALNNNNNNNNAINNANLIKNQIKSIDSGLTESWQYSADSDSLTFKPIQQNTKTSNTPTSSVTQTSKSRLKSIFSSNSNGVKFSLKSASNQTNKPRGGGLSKIFSLNKNKTVESSSSSTGISNPILSMAQTTTTTTNEIIPVENQSDNIDNILKKYSTNNNSKGNESILIDISSPPPPATTTTTSNQTLTKNYSSNSFQMQLQQQNEITYDSNNLESSKLYLDAKKKLRNTLSWSDCFHFLPLSIQRNSKENFLRMYLKTQLFETISNQDKEKEAQLLETIRCISIFSDKDCRKLLRSLKTDYQKRIPYITYLTKSKQNILYSLNLIDKLQQRSKWYQTICTNHLVTAITRSFLESQENEKQLNQFVHTFRQYLTVDEKFESFKIFINLLKKEFTLIWNECDSDTIDLSVVCLERLIIPKVYRFAMFPNGDIDHYRDTKVSECFNELASIITPSHRHIGIPAIYENECPWLAAQLELRRINVYKTPQDKLACIRKCLLTIQNLLAMAKSPVCADDLHPVLIYVIIKANPPTFLSNVQYIEGFYGNQLESEDYYWAQFIFAFSYIKANMLSSI